MKPESVVAALGALASGPRLAVFRLLVRRGPRGFTPSDIAERMAIPAPTLSFHLKALLRANLVVCRRESRNLFYSPDFERMKGLLSFLTDNCCSLADEACDADCRPVASVAQRKRA